MSNQPLALFRLFGWFRPIVSSRTVQNKAKKGKTCVTKFSLHELVEFGDGEADSTGANPLSLYVARKGAGNLGL